MADEQQRIDIIVSYHYGKRIGTRKHQYSFTNINAARKAAKTFIREGYKVSKITVWLDDNHCAVWLKGTGWGPIREVERRRRRR